jgi:hypothetical protein
MGLRLHPAPLIPQASPPIRPRGDPGLCRIERALEMRGEPLRPVLRKRSGVVLCVAMQRHAPVVTIAALGQRPLGAPAWEACPLRFAWGQLVEALRALGRRSFPRPASAAPGALEVESVVGRVAPGRARLLGGRRPENVCAVLLHLRASHLGHQRREHMTLRRSAPGGRPLPGLERARLEDLPDHLDEPCVRALLAEPPHDQAVRQMVATAGAVALAGPRRWAAPGVCAPRRMPTPARTHTVGAIATRLLGEGGQHECDGALSHFLFP